MADSFVMSDATPAVNQKKIRIGLAIITAIFVASLIMVVVVGDPIGKAVFAAVGLVCVVRMVLLVRWLRRGRP